MVKQTEGSTKTAETAWSIHKIPSDLGLNMVLNREFYQKISKFAAICSKIHLF